MTLTLSQNGQCHPLGRCVGTSAPAVGLSCALESAERLPNVCLYGPGSVLGGGLFLTYFNSMKMRAKTDVTVLCYDTQVRHVIISEKGSSQFFHFHMIPSHNNLNG